MSGLCFSLSQEEIKQIKQLIVSITTSQSTDKRNLYATDIKKLIEEKDKEAVAALIEAQLRAQNKPLNYDISTLVMQKVAVAPHLVDKVLRSLAKTGKVFYKKQKIFIDPLSKISLQFRAEDKGESIEVQGILSLGSKSFKIEECEEIFFGEIVYFLHGGVLLALQGDIDDKWVQMVYPKPAVLIGQKKEQFKDLFGDGEPPMRAPQIFWVGEKKEEVVEDPYPILVLNDRTGAFANLYMNYGAKGKFAFNESSSKEGFRNKEKEKYWEKDLLETDFQKKMVGGTHYYCPIDKVAKSLTFLLEMGWNIQDTYGKTLVRQCGIKAFATEEKEAIVFKGQVSFDKYEADLTDVIGAFNKRNQFVDLSENTIGLIDKAKIEEWNSFQDAEVKDKGFVIKKHRFGELSHFFDKKEVEWQESLKNLKKEAINRAEKLCEVSSHFKGVLFAHQQEGVNWIQFLYRNGFGGLLADEMGLGKTVQVLAFLSTLQNKESPPFLIVTSTSLVGHWRREIERFLPETSYAIFDRFTKKEGIEAFKDHRIVITTYPILRLEQLSLAKQLFGAIILDEAQIIKNPSSQTAEAAFSLSAPLKLALTGTPIENKWDDLWSIFHFLNPALLGELNSFKAKCTLAGADKRQLLALKNRIKPFILRREKTEVAKDLPEKIEQEIYVEMTEPQRELYEEVLKKRKKEVLGLIEQEGMQKSRMHVLEAILRLRQIATHPALFSEGAANFADIGGKIPKILEDIEAVLAGKEKVLVFSQFTSLLKLIAKELEDKGLNYCYLDGETKDREAQVQKFQEDENTPIFLISLKAGGMGLNLQKADYVFLCEPWWNEAVERQAIDRAHRIGRNKPVIARRYLSVESIEEKMQKIKEHKKALITAALSLDEVGNLLSNEELYDLLFEAFAEV